MGSSSSILVHHIMQQIYIIKPRSVLDVGYGTGKWGFLIREKGELRNGRKKEDFVLRIDGVDVDERWRSPLHEYVYDDLYTKDIREWDVPRSYDLIFMGDIIEHLTKEEGKAVLQKLLKKCRFLLVSAPFGFVASLPGDEGLREHYPYEQHKSEWTYDDFKDLGERVLSVRIDNPNFMVLLQGDLKNRHEVDEVKEI